MRLTDKQQKTTGKDWDYSLAQIKTTDITQIRLAVYDNFYEQPHLFEKSRYRGEVQIWTHHPHNKPCNYKLFSYMSNYKTFKNNKWKSDTDPNRHWYSREVDRARNLNELYGSEATVAHCCLSMNKMHSGRTDGSFGQYNMPQWAMHMMVTQDVMGVKLDIEEFEFEVELDKTSDRAEGAKLYYTTKDVS